MGLWRLGQMAERREWPAVICFSLLLGAWCLVLGAWSLELGVLLIRLRAPLAKSFCLYEPLATGRRLPTESGDSSASSHVERAPMRRQAS